MYSANHGIQYKIELGFSPFWIIPQLFEEMMQYHQLKINFKKVNFLFSIKGPSYHSTEAQLLDFYAM